MTIDRTDLMDTAEVAAHLGVSVSAVTVALSSPETSPRIARLLPEPIGKVGRSWVWRRADIERIES